MTTPINPKSDFNEITQLIPVERQELFSSELVQSFPIRNAAELLPKPFKSVKRVALSNVVAIIRSGRDF